MQFEISDVNMVYWVATLEPGRLRVPGRATAARHGWEGTTESRAPGSGRQAASSLSKHRVPCTPSSDGKHQEISVKAYLPLSQIQPGNKDNGLTSLLLTSNQVFISGKIRMITRTPKHGDSFHITGILWWKTLVTGGFSFQMASNPYRLRFFGS